MAIYWLITVLILEVLSIYFASLIGSFIFFPLDLICSLRIELYQKPKVVQAVQELITAQNSWVLKLKY